MSKKNLAFIMLIFGAILIFYAFFDARTKNREKINELEKQVVFVENLLEEKREEIKNERLLEEEKEKKEITEEKEESKETLSQETVKGAEEIFEESFNEKTKNEFSENKNIVDKKTKPINKGKPTEIDKGKEESSNMMDNKVNEGFEVELENSFSNEESNSGEKVTFYIDRGMNSEQIGKLLQKKGLVEASVFNKRVQERKLTKRLIYGRYTVEKNIDVDELITILSTIYR
ncbi:MAG: endolytic transglycosylase MltG [Tissierellia bacterium]|nr:endolytic transglycosylase MltG [Tissierellia bacterium]